MPVIRPVQTPCDDILSFSGCVRSQSVVGYAYGPTTCAEIRGAGRAPRALWISAHPAPPCYIEGHCQWPPLSAPRLPHPISASSNHRPVPPPMQSYYAHLLHMHSGTYVPDIHRGFLLISGRVYSLVSVDGDISLPTVDREFLYTVDREFALENIQCSPARVHRAFSLDIGSRVYSLARISREISLGISKA